MSEYELFFEDFTGTIRKWIKPDGVPVNEITTVAGWIPFRSETGGHLPPEMHVVDKANPNYLEPVMRLNEKGRALKIFKQWAKIDAGYYKQATVPAGITELWASLNGHAWYSQSDAPMPSLYKAADGNYYLVTEGMRLWIGIDPTGGTDPWADSVKWAWDNIFDKHDLVSVCVLDPGALATVFVRADNDYGFAHVDAYIASVGLTGYTEDPDNPEDPEEPVPSGWTSGREQYERTFVLMPPDCNDAWPIAALRATWDSRRYTVGGSADDAGIGPEVRKVIAVNPGGWPTSLEAFFDEYYPGIEYIVFNAQNPDDLEDALVDYIHGGVIPDPGPDPPQSSWKPAAFVPTGIKLGWHATGNCGLANMPNTIGGIDYGIYGSNMIAPTIKLVTAIKDIQYMPCSYPMVRLIDKTPSGESVDFQSFDYNGNPEAQAEKRVADLVRALAPYAGQFKWTELCNEQDIPDLAHAEMIARYSIRAMEVAPTWLRIAHFSFGTGNPELEYWKPIADTGVFELIAARGDALAFHSYHDHRVEDDLVWHLTRYRFLYSDYILPRQLDIPMVLTECGPWRHLFDDPTFDLKEWIIVTDQWLAEDPYAMAQIYTVSDVGTEKKYNTAFKALYPWFIEYAKSVVNRQNGDAAPSVPPVLPIPPLKQFSQRDPRWSSIKLGTSNETMYGSGCLVTAVASVGAVLDPEMDPLKLVTWMNANGGFADDGRMLITKPTAFIDGLEYAGYHLWRLDSQDADMMLVREALARGPVIIQVDYDSTDNDLDSHFVVATHEEDGDLWIMDPWTGEMCLLMQKYNRGSLEKSIFAMLDYRFNLDPEPEPELTREPYIGFNDHEGVGGGAARFLSDNVDAVTCSLGFLLQPAFIGGAAWNIDASELEAKGIRTIVNLRYSWSTDCGGAGTLPKPYTNEWGAFVDAAVNTINNSRGVWGWTIGNEYNAPREVPLAGPLTPQDVVLTYNYIYERCNGARLSPGALDPFNAIAGDPRDWLMGIFGGIHDAAFVAAHGYVRGPDPSLVGSVAKFTDHPLTWQYLNYPGCITALLSYLPEQYAELPVYVTEFNHLWKTSEAVGDIGWVTDARAAEVIHAAYAAAREAGFAGLALYRWTGDEWAVKDNGVVLEAVKTIL